MYSYESTETRFFPLVLLPPLPNLGSLIMSKKINII